MAIKNKIKEILSSIILFICAGYFCFEAASIVWKGYVRFVWADKKYSAYIVNRDLICLKVAYEGKEDLLKALDIAEKLGCNKQEFIDDVYKSYINNS